MDEEACESCGKNLLRRIGFASLGAGLTALIVTPFDLVRIRIQSTSLSTRHPPAIPSHTIQNILRTDGIRGLWKGISATLLTVVPSSAFYIISYEYLRDALNQNSMSAQNNAGLNAALAGLLSRSLTVSVISPLELLRIRVQQTGNERKSMAIIMKTILDQTKSSSDGVRVLWRGLGPTLWRDVPFSAIYWSGFEYVKSHLLSHDISHSSWHASFISGALNGAIASVLTHPFDVAKTRIQMEQAKGNHQSNSRQLAMLNVLSRINRTEGFRGLMKGLVPRVAKIAPACAIMISIYEYGKM